MMCGKARALGFPRADFAASSKATQMPVVVFANGKGGVGKTLSGALLATVLAEQGASVAIIDGDTNYQMLHWAHKPGLPANISLWPKFENGKLIGDHVSETTILNFIEDAAENHAFVIVDLEGASTMKHSFAISQADLVLIPIKGSETDAWLSAKTLELVKLQAKSMKRHIPYAYFLTQTNPAITPGTQRYVEAMLNKSGEPRLRTHLHHREAFSAMMSFGGTLSTLKSRGVVSNVETAMTNANAFVAEVIETLHRAAAARAGVLMIGHAAE
jgi:chromosome partitioning protein